MLVETFPLFWCVCYAQLCFLPACCTLHKSAVSKLPIAYLRKVFFRDQRKYICMMFAR